LSGVDNALDLIRQIVDLGVRVAPSTPSA